MIGLLKADFYRLFRSKFFYILGAVIFVLSLAVLGLYVLVVNFGGTMTAEGFQRLSFDGTVGYCAAIASAIFVCSDHSGGGIRDKVVTGCGRRKVFYSEWIVLSVASVCYYLLPQIVVFAFGGAVFGWADARVCDVLSLFVAGIFVSLAYAAIFCSISLLLKKLSHALLLSVLGMFGISLILGVLSVAEFYMDSSAFSVFCDVLRYITPVGQNSVLASGSDAYWALSAAACGWLLLAGIGVPLLFARQDLK